MKFPVPCALKYWFIQSGLGPSHLSIYSDKVDLNTGVPRPRFQKPLQTALTYISHCALRCAPRLSPEIASGKAASGAGMQVSQWNFRDPQWVGRSVGSPSAALAAPLIPHCWAWSCQVRWKPQLIHDLPFLWAKIQGGVRASNTLTEPWEFYWHLF